MGQIFCHQPHAGVMARARAGGDNDLHRLALVEIGG